MAYSPGRQTLSEPYIYGGKDNYPNPASPSLPDSINSRKIKIKKHCVSGTQAL